MLMFGALVIRTTPMAANNLGFPAWCFGSSKALMASPGNYTAIGSSLFPVDPELLIPCIHFATCLSLDVLFLLKEGYRSYNHTLSLLFPSSLGLPLHFSMPTCFCVTRGCYSSGGKDPISHKALGRNVDGRTYKAHTVADRQAAFRAAEENTEAVLTSQIEEITAHLSASVLADSVSGPSLVPGGP